MKQILEQNMRDLQGQYYQVVKDLDSAKSDHETQIKSIEETISAKKEEIADLNQRLQAVKDESDQHVARLNEYKDSSQLLEKKYHRAKKIIKEMQLREQSFNRREQIYQQKIDEIENELSAFVDSLSSKLEQMEQNKANSGAHRLPTTTPTNSYPSVTDTNSQFGAQSCLRAVLSDYNKKPGNPEIRQRVLNILKQHINIPDVFDHQTVRSLHGTSMAEMEDTTMQQQQQLTGSRLSDHQVIASQLDDSMNHHSINLLTSDGMGHHNSDHEVISNSFEPTSLSLISDNILNDHHQITTDSQNNLLQHATTAIPTTQQQHNPTKFNVIQRMSSMASTMSASIGGNQYDQRQISSSICPTTKQQQQATVSIVQSSNRHSQPPIMINSSMSKIAHNRLSLHQPSPPDSVNSYTSSASLNSLSVGGPMGTSTSNLPMGDTNLTVSATSSKSQLSQQRSNLPISSASSSNFIPVSNIQVPYETVEWHEKPGNYNVALPLI